MKRLNEALECLVNEMLAYSNEGEDKMESTSVGEEVGSSKFTVIASNIISRS
jgi:hypothetical protein